MKIRAINESRQKGDRTAAHKGKCFHNLKEERKSMKIRAEKTNKGLIN